jgi:hypothetical protein
MPEDPSPAPPTTLKKTKKVWCKKKTVIVHYYFSRYGRLDLNLIRYGERSSSSNPTPRASLGEIPFPRSIASFYCFHTNKINFIQKN